MDTIEFERSIMRIATLILLALTASGMCMGHASAAFLTPDFVGNTEMSDSGDTGIVNFAVFENTGSDWRTALGLDASQVQLLSGVIDPTDRFVLMYQVVNTSPPGSSDSFIESVVVDTNGFPYSSAGYLADSDSLLLFDEATPQTGKVGPSGNRYLGSEPTSGTDPAVTKGDDPLNGTPSEMGNFLDTTDVSGSSWFVDVTDASETDAVRPTSGFRGTAALDAQFSFGLDRLTVGKYSPILFLTSNHAPISYGEGQVDNSNGESNGDIPVHAPEASALAVWGGLFAAMGVVVLCRRRRRVALA